MSSALPTPTARMRLLAQLSRFSVVGVINTVVDLAVLNAETLVSGVKDGGGYAAQKAVSFFTATAVSYLLNKRWTFRDPSPGRHGRRFAQFLMVSGLGAVVNVTAATAVVTYGKTWAPLTDQLWVNLGALCGTAAGFVWNFFGYKFLVFRGAP